MVNHNLLLEKLKGYGITGSLHDWFSSYLINRGLMVRFAGSCSKTFLALSGVPQGSHLAPFLFSLFLNDICSVIDTKCLMFADDIKIFIDVNCLEDCERLQRTLQSVEFWCRKSGMNLNASKSAILTYSRSKSTILFQYTLSNDALSRVDRFKDLGVVMSSSLSPWDHISYICNRAYSLMGFLCRTSGDFRSPSTLVMLFKTIVRPILEYSSIVWCPYQAGHIEALEQIQVRILRLVGVRLGHQYLETPVDTLRTSFDLPPLATRRRMADVLFLHKLVNGALDCPDLLSLLEFRIPTSTRSKDIFSRRALPSLYSHHSCVPRLMREGNEVAGDVEFFGSSHQSFRSSLRRILQ